MLTTPKSKQSFGFADCALPICPNSARTHGCIRRLTTTTDSEILRSSEKARKRAVICICDSRVNRWFGFFSIRSPESRTPVMSKRVLFGGLIDGERDQCRFSIRGRLHVCAMCDGSYCRISRSRSTTSQVHRFAAASPSGSESD